MVYYGFPRVFLSLTMGAPRHVAYHYPPGIAQARTDSEPWSSAPIAMLPGAEVTATMWFGELGWSKELDMSSYNSQSWKFRLNDGWNW